MLQNHCYVMANKGWTKGKVIQYQGGTWIVYNWLVADETQDVVFSVPTSLREEHALLEWLNTSIYSETEEYEYKNAAPFKITAIG